MGVGRSPTVGTDADPARGSDVRVGITLPQFREDAETALATARHAEAAGLDGVFVFDHLWPIGRPDRPALHAMELLGALAVETTRTTIGSMVARVGVYPDTVLVHGLATVGRMAGGRLIAGLGVGDHLSRAENLAFGVPFAPAAERLAGLARCCRDTRATGVPTWVGGVSAGTRAVAMAEADAWNMWGVPAARIAAEVAAITAGDRQVAVTWADQVRPLDDDLPALLRSLAAAGAAWAVLAPIEAPWPDAVDRIAA